MASTFSLIDRLRQLASGGGFPSQTGLDSWMSQRRAPVAPDTTEDGTPLFRAEGVATPDAPEPQANIAAMLSGMPRVEPMPSAITGTPELPPEPNDLAWARQLGRAVLPPPSTDSPFPAAQRLTAAGHPRMGGWLENFMVAENARSQNPTVPFAGQMALAEFLKGRQAEQDAYEGNRIATGLGLAGKLDAMAAGRTAAERAAALNESEMVENYAQAANQRRLANTPPAPEPMTTAQLVAQRAALEAIPEAQRTPEQANALQGLRAALPASQYDIARMTQEGQNNRLAATQNFTAQENKLNRQNQQAVARVRAEIAANPKPLSSADTVKVKGKLTSIAAARQQLQELKDRFYGNPQKGIPGIQGTSDADPAGVLRFWSENGQRYDAAVDNLRSTMTSLTRTPGIGAMSNYETGIDQSKFPSRGIVKKPEVLRDQIGYLDQLIDTLDAGYGEMLNAGAQGGEPPASNTPEAGSIRTYPNGRKARWDGVGWEAIN